MLKLVFDEAGFRSLICNWEELAAILLRRLKKQVLAYKRPEAEVLLRELLAMDPPAQWEQPTLPSFEGPMATTQIRVGEKKLSLFSTLTQFGTALDVGMEELVIESYFPADSETKQFFTALM